VTIVVTLYLLQHVKSESSSSSEEENDEISKILDQQVRQEIEMAKLDNEKEKSKQDDVRGMRKQEQEEGMTKQEKENDEQENKMDCMDDINTDDFESCFINKCKAICVVVNIKVTDQAENVEEGCNSGCKDQIYAFRSVQAPYPNTSPKLLLGTAVDKCWNGCIDQYTGFRQTSCISGCEAMRKLQAQQLNMLGSKAANSKAEVISELKEDNGKADVESQLKEDNSKAEVQAGFKADITNDDVKANDGNAFYEVLNNKKNVFKKAQEPDHVVRTYVLYHPFGQVEEDPSQETAYQTYNLMMDMVKRMFQRMDMDMVDTDKGNKDMFRGWKDDTKQLRLPQFQPRSSAFTNQEEDDTNDVYNKIVESLGKLKANIDDTVSQPEFKENLFYILMTISCFLLLTALYDNCTETDTDDTDTEDDSAVLVKLPSYEECIKTDGYITVDIVDTKHNKEAEEDKQGGENDMTKVNLSLSVVLGDGQMETK